jgi:membrane protease subunit HflK
MIALGTYLLTGFYIVPADKQALVIVCGRVNESTIRPGIHWTWPYPLAMVAEFKVREIKRISIGLQLPDQTLGRTHNPMRAQFHSGDRNIINIHLVAQFAIKEPVAYLFETRDLETLVANTVESALTSTVVRRRVDDLLTTEKASAQQEVHLVSQNLLDDYGCGVTILGINIESISPPEEVLEAFRDVASARGDKDRIIRQAESYANGLIPVARGKAERIKEEAVSYARRVVNEALGDAARFASMAGEYEKVPDETRIRLYLETMEEVLPRIKKYIVESDSNAIDLDFFNKK